MAHDVFISHSSKDKKAADAICHSLEQAGVKCWIAPRDITPGAEYAEQLLMGIKNCKVFLLIFSKKSNVSSAVAKEIESAVRHEKTIIPYRIDKVEMRASLEYYLANLHWLDAYPDEKEFESLVKAVQTALGKAISEQAAKQEKSTGTVSISKKTLIFCGTAVAIAVALVFVFAMNFRNGDTTPVYGDGVYIAAPEATETEPSPPAQEEEIEVPPPVQEEETEIPPPVQEAPPPVEPPPPVQEVPPPVEPPPPVQEVPPPVEAPPPVQEAPPPAEIPPPAQEAPPAQTDTLVLSAQNITGERLAEMVANGEIPANVTRLNLSNNPIGDISPLGGLSNLTWLQLQNNQISDITPLAGLTALTALSLESNQIRNIAPLAGLTNLTELSIANNLVEDIAPLTNLTNLTDLSLANNQIRDVGHLHTLTGLRWLSVARNTISSEQISALGDTLENTTVLHFPQN